ncbi:HAD-IA family hydrolase [Propioniciclava sp.]|uniref:HAD-IA family hydrolase n=1 Tax=Propioniciclava sp. TaxID=2038686 RepID=UPI0026164395|nr:HAD-IA family hydrolase [Propioniciclava sp.]
MYRNLVWDLGGTLVDTYPALDAAFAAVVARHGHEVAIADVARLTRTSTHAALARLAERFGIDPAEFERANADLKARWDQTPPPAMPGAGALLVDVRAAGGLNLVVTHRERSSAEALLAGLGLPVDDIIATSDGHPRKPDPTMYRLMLARHGLDAAACLAVGDRPIDATAAQAAGIDAALLESPEAPVEDDARYSVATLDELRPLLGLANTGR